MKTRKLLAMLLTLSMVLSLAAPAFADNEEGGSTEPEIVETTPDPEPSEEPSEPVEGGEGDSSEEPPVEEHTHSWTETGRTEATCTADGSIEYACECGETKSETIPSNGHSYSEEVTTEPTCSAEGEKTLTCSVCGDVTTESIPTVEHTWSETGRTEATCSAAGSIEYTCSECGATKSEEIPVLEHTWTETGRTEAGCETAGSIEYTCDVCGETKTEEIAALGHTWTEEITTPATCTTEGAKHMTCSVCGAEQDETIPVTEHTWDAGVVTTEPTTNAQGEKTYTCTVCGATKTETIPALDAPVMTPEMNQLVSSLQNASSKAMFNLIKKAFSGLFDQLPADVKAQLMAFFNSLPGEGSLYDQLMTAETLEEFESILAEYSEEELIAVEKSLTEDQLAALEAHIQMLAEASYVPPVSVPFTEAGPLLPAVEVETTYRAPRRARAMNSQDDKIQTSKILDTWNSATKTGTLKIEAYVTGTYSVTESTNAKPVDIVLVLDQSGSMAFDFNGETTHDNSARRQTAMKNTVSSFIDKVSESYSNTADHRMAIVTFGSSVETKCGWTDLGSGKATLINSVKNLPNQPSGATRIDYGVKRAENLMGSGYSYKGANNQRQKVVIVFTDGIPTSSSEFETDVANAALTAAHNLKTSGVTVYSIGVFGGVNPNQLYDETKCSGNVGDRWKYDNWGLFPGSDFPEADIPAGNRFLNYLSTNCPSATSIGLNRRTYGSGFLYSGVSYKITSNFNKTSNEYYLTATNASELEKMFEAIRNQIGAGGTTIQLNEDSVVRDVISPYFTVNTTGNLKAYSVPCTGKSNGEYTFDENKRSGSFTVHANGKTVDASGFNFNEKYVAETGRDLSGQNPTGDYYGEKLVIEIPIKAEDEFWGGNNVPTNEMAASGVFMTPDSEKPEVGLGTSSPLANVQLKDFEVEGVDKHIYYGDAVEIKPESMAQITTEIPNDWRTDYINRTPAMTNSATGGIDRTQDAAYTINVTLSPSRSADSSKGAEAQPKTKEATANVYVYTPTVTFGDMRTYLTVPASVEKHTPKSVTWFHTDSEGKTTQSTAVTMVGTEPNLSFEIVGRVNDQYGDGANPVVRNYHALVKTVTIGNSAPITHRNADQKIADGEHVVKFEHDNCGEDRDELVGDFDPSVGEFLVHVFKPVITFHDTTRYKGEGVLTDVEYKTESKPEVKWVYSRAGHDDVEWDDAKADIPVGTTLNAPALDYGFTTDASGLDTTKGYYVSDAPVAVQVMIGTEKQTTLTPVNSTPVNVNSYVTFRWNDANDSKCSDCDNSSLVPHPENHFYVHVKTCTLTVKKALNGQYSNTDSFLFTIKGSGNPLADTVNTEIFITGAGSKTITGLPVGIYTVEEDTDWSWRYEQTDVSPKDGKVELKSDNIEDSSVTITNKLTNTKWLSDENVAVNTFLCVNKPVVTPTPVIALVPEKQDEI